MNFIHKRYPDDVLWQKTEDILFYIDKHAAR